MGPFRPDCQVNVSGQVLNAQQRIVMPIIMFTTILWKRQQIVRLRSGESDDLRVSAIEGLIYRKRDLQISDMCFIFYWYKEMLIACDIKKDFPKVSR